MTLTMTEAKALLAALYDNILYKEEDLNLETITFDWEDLEWQARNIKTFLNNDLWKAYLQ